MSSGTGTIRFSPPVKKSTKHSKRPMIVASSSIWRTSHEQEPVEPHRNASRIELDAGRILMNDQTKQMFISLLKKMDLDGEAVLNVRDNHFPRHENGTTFRVVTADHSIHYVT